MAEGGQDGDRESFEDRGGGNGPAPIAALGHEDATGEDILERTGNRHVDARVVPYAATDRRPGGVWQERGDEARHAGNGALRPHRRSLTSTGEREHTVLPSS